MRNVFKNPTLSNSAWWFLLSGCLIAISACTNTYSNPAPLPEVPKLNTTSAPAAPVQTQKPAPNSTTTINKGERDANVGDVINLRPKFKFLDENDLKTDADSSWAIVHSSGKTIKEATKNTPGTPEYTQIARKEALIGDRELYEYKIVHLNIIDCIQVKIQNPMSLIKIAHLK